MVIVVLVLGILAAAAVPKYADALVRMRLDAAARRIAADLATAQARARATSSSQAVTFTLPPAGSRYEIAGMSDPDRPAATYAVNLAEAPYQVTLGTVDLGGNASLIYNGYGVPNGGATIVIQAGKYARKITIDPDTGIAAIDPPVTTVDGTATATP
jgi:type II secretory pathway pseudopilin PulG